MDKQNKSLVIQVHQSDQVRQFVIHKGGKFTVGQHGDNDLTLYGQNYPKRHILFSQENSSFVLNVKRFIEGEISLDNSRLQIRDLIQHDVLPRKGDNLQIRLAPPKHGVLKISDIKIEFQFNHVQTPRAIPVSSPAFSWTRATVKNLKSDLLFKFIFLFLFTIHTLAIYAFRDYEVTITKKFDINKVPERLAKFIPKPPEAIMEIDNKSLSGLSENAENNNDQKKNENQSANNKGGNRKGSGEKRGNPAATAGLLGLLAGTGSGGKSSSIVDALVDRGLVADLNNIVGGGTHLKVAPGGGKGNADPLDQLIGTGGSGGIDDFLSAMEEDVPQVKLNKKAKVDLVKPSKMTGSAEALGRRTDESVMQVVLSRQGRITYLYEKYLKRNPNLRGKISIEFTISANGFVASARIIESTINHPELEQDILNLIKHLKFDPIPTGDVTTIFPFQFSNVN
jgi:TonB family protein